MKDTTLITKKSDADRKWVHIDAAGVPLGRVATRAALILRGKHRPTYTPHVDTGDFVVITNAKEVVLTGKKALTKKWSRHSGRPGLLKQTPYGVLRETNPARLVEIAIFGMLPKNRLGRRLFTKLKVYGGADHPHQAQQPKKVGPQGEERVAR